MSARPPWSALGAGVRIRRAIPSDKAKLAAFLRDMDREGLYQRHFSYGEAPNLALLERLGATARGHGAMLLALAADSRVIGQAEYAIEGRGAEFALMVLPGWRHLGVGKALLESLVRMAAEAGLDGLHGLIQATNGPALALVRHGGFRVRAGDDATTVIVSRALLPEPAADPADCPGFVPPAAALPSRHDPDRTPLYRCPRP